MDKIQSIKQRFEIIGNDPQLNRAIGKAIRVSPTDISPYPIRPRPNRRIGRTRSVVHASVPLRRQIQRHRHPLSTTPGRGSKYL